MCDIVKRFKNGVDVEQELRKFNDKLNLARLPKFETILTLKTAGNPIDKSASCGAITGGAASMEENYMSNESENTTETQEDSPTLLHGGLQYYHNTDSQNEENDYYVENEIEEEGYTGDSMEAVIEYKRKHDEEQKQKAIEQSKQKAANTTNQNWILPVSKGHKITSGFGKRIPPVPGASDFHDGIDINALANTPVYAVANGTVVVSGWVKGYGNYIEIDHKNGIHSFYGHLNKIYVKWKAEVQKGQNIGLSGNTGIGTGAHLHFGVHVNGVRKNPTLYLPNF